MTRSTRLFEIIQILRAAHHPVNAQDMADMLEVSVRTIYRDIATLQAMQTPIYGQAGIGYEMRKGYDLPPVHLDTDEAEAVALGLTMIARTGDTGLLRAAGRAARKLHEIAPGTRHLVASAWGNTPPETIDITQIRQAIRDEHKLQITYCDEHGVQTDRIIWPLVVIYYFDRAMIAAWCEKRAALRHFRVDRIRACSSLTDNFKGQSITLLKQWEQNEKPNTVLTHNF